MAERAGKRGGAEKGLRNSVADMPAGDYVPPDYQYVAQLVATRKRVYGGGAGTVRASGARTEDESTGGAPANVGRSASGGVGLETLIREVRLRRQMRIDPRIPRAYRKTTQVVRPGQSLLADLGVRIPAVLGAKPMQVRAEPLDDEEDSMVAATLKEDFIHAVLLGAEGRRGLMDQGGDTSVWRLWLDNLVNATRGAFTLQVRDDRWSPLEPGYPKRSEYQDDGDDVPEGKRQSGDRKWTRAVERFKRQQFPFVLESCDPLSVYAEKDDEGRDDEAIVVAQRPYRKTLSQYGLKPAGQGERGRDVLDGDTQQYRAGPRGFGVAYPPNEFPTTGKYPDAVQTVTWYGSARRAFDLGLTDGDDPDLGVWAHYVDGVLVDSGPLWGPSWHPLPVFRAVGLPTAMPDPTYEGVSGIMHLLELADVLDQIFTMEMHVAYWSAWPPIVEEDATSGAGATGIGGDTIVDPERAQRPGGPVARERKVIEPAGFYKVPPGRRWRYMTLPAESTAHLERLYTKARELFDLLGVPGVFRGAGGPSQAGYAIAQLLIAAKSMYDPLLSNSCAAVRMSVMWMWWQIWKRFPEGVSVYVGGDATKDKKGGWITLRPQDIAPDAKPGTAGAGTGTPFLACSVTAEPLMPVDEAQLEQRGINALTAKVLDIDNVREHYFKDPAPEKTAARVMADEALAHPIAVSSLRIRALVQQKLLLPELAPLVFAQEVGIPPELAVEQLKLIDALPPESLQRIQAMQAMKKQQEQQQLAAAAAGQTPPGMQAIPGAPGLPGPAQPAPAMPAAPAAPQGPPIGPGPQPGPGGPLNQGGQPQAQNLPRRIAAAAA